MCNCHLQAYHGKQDDPVEEEDVANAETETQDHADDTGPMVLDQHMRSLLILRDLFLPLAVYT
jgi:hypothetical protein